MKKKFLKKENGFTLIETMVAITVLMFAVLGPLSIASSSLATSRLARDQVTAFYLAQEGLEFIRYMRDTNYLNGDGWIYGMDDCFNSSGCSVDVSDYFNNSSNNPSDVIDVCDSDGCPYLNNDGEGLYVQSSEGQFQRTIKVNQISSTELKVDVNVSWRSGNLEKEVNLTENIRDLYSPEE